MEKAAFEASYKRIMPSLAIRLVNTLLSLPSPMSLPSLMLSSTVASPCNVLLDMMHIAHHCSNYASILATSPRLSVKRQCAKLWTQLQLHNHPFNDRQLQCRGKHITQFLEMLFTYNCRVSNMFALKKSP